MKIEYFDVNLNDVMKYYAKDFTKKGKKIRNLPTEWYIDTNKNRAIFKLYIEDEKISN